MDPLNASAGALVSHQMRPSQAAQVFEADPRANFGTTDMGDLKCGGREKVGGRVLFSFYASSYDSCPLPVLSITAHVSSKKRFDAPSSLPAANPCPTIMLAPPLSSPIDGLPIESV